MNAVRGATEFVAPADDPVIVFRRMFNAPARLMFEVWSAPEHLRHWRGPRGFELVGCEVDLRVGGGYRFVHRVPGGGHHVFSGRYLEIERPRRLLSMFIDEAAPDIEVLDEVTFADNGATTLVTGLTTFPTLAVRDLYLDGGAQRGLTECHDLLDELLSSRVSPPRNGLVPRP